MKVYLQKANYTGCEFVEYDIVTDEANHQNFLGDINIRQGMDVTILVAKLRDTADKIEKSNTDVLVVQ